LGASHVCALNTHMYQQEIVLNEVQFKIIHNHKPLSVFGEKYIKCIEKGVYWLKMKPFVSNSLWYFLGSVDSCFLIDS